MDFLDTIILGAVEGLTEFLPVSSTAHLLLTGKILGIPETEFFKTFVISIQIGAILAVLFLYTKRILSSKNLILKIATAFIPTAIIGFIFYQIIKNILFENLITIAWALIVGGVIILFFEKFKKEDESEKEIEEEISFKKSFLLGVIQALAIIPGVSRSGATIIGGRAINISKKNIVEFSFLLAIPTIIASAGYDIFKSSSAIGSENLMILISGLLLSFVFGVIAIKSFLSFIKKHSFVIFGWYRILAGIAILIFL